MKTAHKIDARALIAKLSTFRAGDRVMFNRSPSGRAYVVHVSEGSTVILRKPGLVRLNLDGTVQTVAGLFFPRELRHAP